MGAIRTLAAAAIAAAAIPTAAEAATIAYTYEFEYPLLGQGGDHVFDFERSHSQFILPFETSLGELTGVHISSAGLATVSLQLGIEQVCAFPGVCIVDPASGESANTLRSTFMVDGSSLWSEFDFAGLQVEHDGPLNDSAVLGYSFDGNYINPLVLEKFSDTSTSLRMQYLLETHGTFQQEFDPEESFAISSASFSTTVTYEYTKPGGTTPGAVPEPATWAMMVLGFGLVGGGLRRRRGVGRAFAV